MKPRSLVFLLPPLFSVPAGAQTVQQVPPEVRRGLLSTAPIGIQLDESSAPLRIVDPGQSTSIPAPWSTARFGTAGVNHPDYTLAAMFGANASAVELSAFSTGNDLMPEVDEGGFLIMADLWFGLSVSVTNTSTGAPGSHIARLVNEGEAPGAEVFTYYAEGSGGIAPVLINTTTSERSRQSLGLPETTDTVDTEINGLDLGLGVIPFNPANNSAPLFEVRDSFYFSLHPDCLANLPTDFAVELGGASSNLFFPPEAGFVYRLTWELNPTGQTPGVYGWSTYPEIYRTRQDLMLGATDWIDALAVDGDDVDGTVVFSTPPVANRSQVLVNEPGWVGGPFPLRTQSGLEFADQLGLTGSDVDGSCGIDPEIASALNDVLGVAGVSPFGTSAPLGISAFVVKPAASPQGSTPPGTAYIQVTGVSDVSQASRCTLYGIFNPSFGPAGPINLAGWTALGDQLVFPGDKDPTWILPAPVAVGTYAFTAILEPLSGTGPAEESLISWLTVSP